MNTTGLLASIWRLSPLCGVAVRLSPSYRRHERPQSHDVIRRSGEGEDPIDQCSAAMAQLPEEADRFHPAERFLDTLPAPLTVRIATRACCATVDRAVGLLLRDVRR